MDIPQKINAIIAERKKQLPKIGTVLEHVVMAKSKVEEFDRLRNSSENGEAGPLQAMMQANPEFSQKLESVSTREFYEKYMAAERMLKDLQKRFDRDEVHISFVGRAGQGKSLILQRISGLSGDIIPSADGGDCTGAKSIISNGPGEETRAEITFYTEQELVEIVNKYLETIYKTSEYTVFSSDGIARLKGKLPKIDYTQVMEQSLRTHLDKYVDHIEDIRGHLGCKITVPKEEIESYVAQYESKDKDHKYFKYLGVKEAKIISSFPCTQCGKIVLEDTIGTGATSLGVDEAMLKTVKESSDAIIYMMRPEPLRPRITKEDYGMITAIRDAVTPEYARQMLFWVINRVETGKGQNTAQIPEIMAQLRSADLPVAQYLEVNCWEESQVESNFLLPVLNQMSDHLAEIDGLLLNRANEQLRELEAEYRKIANKVEGATGASVSSTERRAFDNKIEYTIGHMTNEIRDLFLEYRERCNTEGSDKTYASDLENAAAIKIKGILQLVPKEEEIVALLHVGTQDVYDALKALGEKIRIQIINDFLDLNVSLRNTVLNMKKSVVHNLAAEDIGRLGFIVAEEDDPEAWLDTMQDKLMVNPDYRTICAAIKPLRDFDLRMENFLIYKVRSCLDPIDWSWQRVPKIQEVENNSGHKLDDKYIVQEFRAIFKDILKSIYDAVKAELSSYYTFPDEALFAAVRDFYDRIIKSGDKTGAVQREWRYLYEDMIPVIWSEEYHSFRKGQDAQEAWSNFIAGIRICTEENYFLIR